MALRLPAWRNDLQPIALCLACSLAAAVMPAQVQESGDLDRATAQALVDELTRDVETRALRPRVPQEYDAAKAHLVALIAGPGPVVPRAAVYAAARAMLATLDTDGHTLLWSREQAAAWQGSTKPESAGNAAAVRGVVGANGRALLVLRPPQATFMDAPSMRAYALALMDAIHRQMSADEPCAVVVDLSDQQGGNAWPVLAALQPLITPANQARFVDRDGVRTPVVAPGVVDWTVGGALPANDLVRLAGRPLAIVLAHQTASAGEMLAIALRGEPGARSFGVATYGATTANLTTWLPDGAMVLLTTSRYAFGEAPPLRGPLRPDVPAADAESADAVMAQAVAWASGQCAR